MVGFNKLLQGAIRRFFEVKMSLQKPRIITSRNTTTYMKQTPDELKKKGKEIVITDADAQLP